MKLVQRLRLGKVRVVEELRAEQELRGEEPVEGGGKLRQRRGVELRLQDLRHVRVQVRGNEQGAAADGEVVLRQLHAHLGLRVERRCRAEADHVERDVRKELLRVDLCDQPAHPEREHAEAAAEEQVELCLLYTSPSPRDKRQSRMPSSA